MSHSLSWAQRIEHARKRGKFTAHDKEIASTFSTCAVGERAGQGHARPADWQLVLERFVDWRSASYLGLDFAAFVNMNDLRRAIKTYSDIQRLKVKP